jgi:hypothetical protein
MNELLLDKMELWTSRQDTQATAKPCLSPAGDQSGGETPFYVTWVNASGSAIEKGGQTRISNGGIVGISLPVLDNPICDLRCS